MITLNQILLFIILIQQNSAFLHRMNNQYIVSESAACKNFQKYACSNYYDESYQNANYSEITEKLDYNFNVKLLDILVKRSALLPNDVNLKQNYGIKLMLYWESCRRETQRNLTKYFEVIQPSSELNWPLLGFEETWLEADKNFDFWPLLGEIQSYGFNNLVVQQTVVRNRDNTLNVLLQPAGEELHLETNILKVLLKALGSPKNMDAVIQDFYDIENKWQEFFPENYSSEAQSIELSLKELSSIYPKLNLSLYLEKLLGYQEMENISQITIKNPSYFYNLNDKIWSKEELMQITNYFMLKVLYYLLKDTTNDFTPYECLKDLRKKFDLATNAYYYFAILDHGHYVILKSQVDSLTMKIKYIMSDFFDNNNLQLSRKQISFLKNKLKSIKINVGNLPLNLDYQEINNFYQDLDHMDIENYFKNHLSLLKHNFKKTLLYTQNQTYFVVTSNNEGGISTPYYIPQQNMIVIPFASFQKPFFYYQQTYLQQLSLFGFILAHEMAHAFDTTGLQYDEHGLLLNHSLGIMESSQFKSSLKCMQQQMPTENIDERLADLFAVKVAYKTYWYYHSSMHKKWKHKFFIYLSEFFCGNTDLKYIDHDSDEIRLQQIIKNSPDFALVFRCPKTSASYPGKQCRLY